MYLSQRRYVKNILILLILFSFQATHAGATVKVESEPFVPDDKTAIAIAKAVLVPIFGETFEEQRVHQTFSKTHIFYAHLYHGDTWIVEDAPSARLKWSEPILRVEIDKKRGCILKVSDSY
jgi:hypothetical protein